jgi:dTDP-4-dehydrorhamnose reductase
MLGHQLLKQYRGRHDVRVTLRRPLDEYATYGLFDSDNVFPNVDAVNFDHVENTVRGFQPEAVINAIGIVKQRSEAQDAILSLEINSLLPHRLSLLCADIGARLIHISTDCVFSGNKGMYTEDDLEDATDLYGRSKLLGEVSAPHAVTLRTSIIGLELSRRKSLIEWFLAQRGSIKGFTRAIYSGFTTKEMARIIELVLLENPSLSGLWHVASSSINKYDLLSLFSGKLGRADVTIVADSSFACDRSLDGTRFERETGYAPPSWDTMLGELAAEAQEQKE